MPNQFCCRNCGMITDNPEIVSHPDRDEEYRRLLEEANKSSAIAGLYERRYNHSITCPVCLNRTCFWRETPFPTDVPPEMKQERCGNNHCFLPKGHDGLHRAVAIITDIDK